MTDATHDPGWLRHRVTLQSAAGAPDGAGGETVTWDDMATLWARIEPTAAREEIVGGHLAGVVTHDITFRWRDDIAGGMRVVYRDRVFRLLAVSDPDERRHYVVAKAREETP